MLNLRGTLFRTVPQLEQFAYASFVIIFSKKRMTEPSVRSEASQGVNAETPLDYFRNRMVKKLKENKIQLAPENEGLFHRISDIVVGVCSKGVLKSTGIVNIKLQASEPRVGDIIIADSKGFGKVANKDEILNSLFERSVVGTYLGSGKILLR
jgi:hypothetical protein